MRVEHQALPGNGQSPPSVALAGPPPEQVEAYEEPEANLREYLRIFRKRRRTILCALCAMVGAAAVYVLAAPRVYRATAKVQVLQPDTPPSLLLLSDATKTPQVSLKTQAKIVQSSVIAGEVAKALALDRIDPVQVTPRDLSRNLRVDMEEPDVLAISVDDTSPGRAKRIADQVQTSYIEHSKETSSEEANSACTFLDDQLASAQRDVEKAEKKVKEYKARYNIEDTDAIAMMKAQVAVNYSAEAERARADMQAATAEIASLRARLAATRPTRVVQHVMNDPVADGFIKEIADLEVELARAKAQFPPTHPKVVETAERLDDLRAQQRQRFGQKQSSFVLQAVEEPNPDYEALRQRLRDQQSDAEALRAKLDALTGVAGQSEASMHDMPQAHLELARLEHTKDVAEKNYLSLLEQLQQAKLNKARELGVARVVDWAEKPEAPVSPRPGRTLVLALILGILAGISVALLQEQVDTSVDDPDELVERTGLTVLGFIPAARSPEMAARITVRSPRSPMAEGMRAVHYNLKFSFLDAPLRTVMVTSASAGEGKSFTSSNLAIISAQAGARTILVDADLRRPTQHKVFNLTRSPGLSNVLAGEVSLDQALQSTEVDGLLLLPAGTTPPNPTALLDSKRMVELVGQLRDRADLVVFDTPPTLLLSDSMVLTSHVDGALLVVQQGKAAVRALAQVRRVLEQGRGHVIGAVINKVHVEHGNYYYHYYTDYYYYSATDGEKRKRRHRRSRMPVPDPAAEPVTAPETGSDADA